MLVILCYLSGPVRNLMQRTNSLIISFLLSDNPTQEHSPSIMLPQGTLSHKMVLRGETLELECIAEGL